MKLFRPLAAMLAALPFVASAEAADYAYRTNERGDVVLTLSGPITSMDGAIFLNEVNRNKPRIIEISGPGGDMLSAARIGVIIHERHLWTHAVGPCKSACAYIWIAGLHMLADEGVEILNHLPVADRGTGEGLTHDKGTALFGWYLGKLDISIDMMEAFLASATAEGTVDNRYFDMVAFAEYWNAPLEIVPKTPKPILAAHAESNGP